MHVLDVNADGRNDIVTAAGHDYGVFWFEQGDGGKWTRRSIDSAWSQGHASTLVDLNRDGRLDLVTGKRFMAHNGTDPGEREPLGVYWYEFRPVPPSSTAKPGAAPAVEWIRHLIEYGGTHRRRHADSGRRRRRRWRSRRRVPGQERAVLDRVYPPAFGSTTHCRLLTVAPF